MVAGKYLAKGSAMGKDLETTIVYEVNGNVLTGSMNVMGKEVEVLEGTVNGDEFQHICKVPPMKIKVSGKVDGDDICFTLKAPPAINAEFVGKRI